MLTEMHLTKKIKKVLSRFIRFVMKSISINPGEEVIFVGMESGYPKVVKPWWKPCDHDVLVRGVAVYDDRGRRLDVPYVEGTDPISGNI
jgi:hypothetical protein